MDLRISSEELRVRAGALHNTLDMKKGKEPLPMDKVDPIEKPTVPKPNMWVIGKHTIARGALAFAERLVHRDSRFGRILAIAGALLGVGGTGALVVGDASITGQDMVDAVLLIVAAIGFIIGGAAQKGNVDE